LLPHSATISMCDACGASYPMHIVNPHYVSVRHLDTADMIMSVTVPSHPFHHWYTISIFLPHSATISMCDACGASCPMHIVNPHMHRPKLHPCPALTHNRYGDKTNSIFTPVSLSVTHFHLLATLHHNLNV